MEHPLNHKIYLEVMLGKFICEDKPIPSTTPPAYRLPKALSSIFKPKYLV
jgi:hypothetical protein